MYLILSIHTEQIDFINIFFLYPPIYTAHSSLAKDFGRRWYDYCYVMVKSEDEYKLKKDDTSYQPS